MIGSHPNEGQGHLALSDIAVLYRTARQAEAITQALTTRTIPCQVVDMHPFYLDGELKRLTYWCLLAADQIDRAELLFLLAQERGIGAKGLAAAEALLSVFSEHQHKDPLTALADTGCGKTDKADKTDLPQAVQKRVKAMQELAAQLMQQDAAVKAVDLLCQQYELDPEEPELVRFRRMATSSPSLPAFAEHLRRHQNSLIYDDRAEAVLLSTLHAAKGLEFRAVFMAGCEDGLLPLAPRTELSKEAEQEHLAEERRLFFVGMTRAAEILYLTGAKERMGFSGLEQRTPSPFLSEIPPDLLRDAPTIVKKRKKAGKQLSLF